MTQAAVSYQVKVLEDRIGAPLFRRLARGVSLTGQGARLAARAGEALETLRDAFAEARKDSADRLVISALATFATRVLGPRLGGFQIAHPEVSTRVDINHRYVDFDGGEANIAIRAGTGPYPGLAADFLMHSEFTPMMSPAFAKAHGPFDRPEDLLRVSRIDPGDAAWGLWFRAAGLGEPDASPGSSEFGTQVLEVGAALAGQGVALLTPLYFQDMVDRGELLRPFDLVVREQVSVWLVYPERRRNAPAVRAFRRWLLEEMRELRAAAGAS